MNDFDNEKLMKLRWDHKENGDQFNYNFIAYDTSHIRVVDIDCILKDVDGKPNPFLELLKTHPYKKSATKSFGRHIFIDKGDVPDTPNRTKQVFDKKFGTDHNNKEGVEYLNGLWGWAQMNDIVFEPQRSTKYNPNIIDFNSNLVKKSSTTKKSSKKKVEKTQNVAGNTNYDYDAIRDNLNNYPDSDIANPQKWGGIVRACAASADEKVYDIVHEVSKRANYSGEEWVRKAWESYNPSVDTSYEFDNFCKKFIPIADLEVNEDCVGHYFLQKFENRFISLMKVKVKNQKLAYFRESDKTWKIGPNICDAIIYRLISTDIQHDYIDRFEVWKKKNIFSQITQKLKKVKQKEIAKEIKKFKSHSFLTKTQLWITNYLLTSEHLEADIQFNLQDDTRHLFQFNNGAFNFKTGKLEPRTRQMYITEYLNYNYSSTRDETRIARIHKIIKKSLPDDESREGFFKWRGVTLTGNIVKAFMYYYGAVGNNGKSFLSEMMLWAFPIYVSIVGCDLFDKDNTNWHKSFASIANTPTRLIFAEEFGKGKIDVNRLKSLIGESKQIPVKPLFQEEIQMRIQFKFEASSNNELNAGNDKALKNRGKQLDCLSHFISDSSKVDEKNHIYLIDPSVKSMFEDTKNCLALFHILAPYSKQYYDNNCTLKLPKIFEKTFAAGVEENDPWAHVIDANIVKGDNDDVITKFELSNFFMQEEHDLPEHKFKLIKQRLKQLGYKYNCDKKKRNKRGCFVGIKFSEKAKEFDWFDNVIPGYN